MNIEDLRTLTYPLELAFNVEQKVSMKINYNDSKSNYKIAEIISISQSYTDKYAYEQTFRFDLTRSLFVPNWCYKKILEPNGSVDEYGVLILAELMNLQYFD